MEQPLSIPMQKLMFSHGFKADSKATMLQCRRLAIRHCFAAFTHAGA
jgi:hypothetical protein